MFGKLSNQAFEGPTVNSKLWTVSRNFRYLDFTILLLWSVIINSDVLPFVDCWWFTWCKPLFIFFFIVWVNGRHDDTWLLTLIFLSDLRIVFISQQWDIFFVNKRKLILSCAKTSMLGPHTKWLRISICKVPSWTSCDFCISVIFLYISRFFWLLCSCQLIRVKSWSWPRVFYLLRFGSV